ncbi:MAG: hypothetical protein HFE77_00065 [Clostridiales bacterium]|nr:hypothetical protein [Clostridiales bacterium]
MEAGRRAKAKNSPELVEERGPAVIRPARGEALSRMSEPLANLGGTAERPVFVPYGMKTGFFYEHDLFAAKEGLRFGWTEFA